MSSLATRVESWRQKHSAAGDFVLIDASDTDQKLIFTLGGHVVKVSLPRSSDAIYEIESDADDLMDWLSSISSYVLDHTGELNLETFLDKSVTLYNKSKSKKSDSAAASDDENWDDEEMGEQKGDDEDQDMNEEGWGDFNEEGEDGVSDESEWSKWHALKKRWAAKEEKLRKEAANAKIDDEKQQKQIFSSKAATKIITNKLVQLMTEGSKTGLYVEPVDDNIFQWRLRLSQFPPESQLYKDLMKLKIKYGFDYVELEMKMLMDLYPFYPPSVRLVRPRLQNFMMGRIVCMEELQLAKWNPVREISDIIDSIRRLLTQYGSVDDTDDVNDPKKDTPPYTALEFQLLRLSMLTEIAPRIVKTMSDVDQKQLIVPKLDPKKMKSTETEATFTKNKKNKTNSANQQNYWASGTGYGHGSGGAEWDHEAYFAAQHKKDLEILAICEEMLAELRPETVPTGLPLVLEQSCMIPFLETYLKNDSITDMEKHHADLYHVIFNICQEMAKHPSIAKLFLLLPGEKRSLHSYIQDLQKQAAIVEKFAAPTSATSSSSSTSSSSTSTSTSSSSSSSTSTAKPKPKTSSSSIFKKKSTPTSTEPTQTLSSRILLMAAAVNTAVQKILDEQNAAAALLSSSSNIDEKMSDEKIDVSRYIELMESYKFGEVEKFVHHHYWAQYQSTEAISRAWTRRLGMEYSDLSKSLPLTPDSSVFLRYHESKMAFCQVLIIAPDGTPYGRGAFLFDVYFPATYPDTPPLVNLQTTGHGSVRFNPNLYNCGKVCLSLLGTWQGSAGESWNAKTSTFLQVAVSIQSLIFVPQPYFNEPGYESSMNTANGKAASDAYNDNIRIQTIKYAMIEMMQKPPPGFEEVIRTHFYLQKDAIMKQCTEWGNTNSGVKALLSSLKTELEKQTLPTSKGS